MILGPMDRVCMLAADTSMLERQTWRKKSHNFPEDFKKKKKIIVTSVMLLHFLFTYVSFFAL